MSAIVWKLRVLLDKPDKTYFPGEVVTGKVVVDTQTAGNIPGVMLQFWGSVHVFWSSTTTSVTSDIRTGIDERRETLRDSVTSDIRTGIDERRETLRDSRNLVKFSIPLYGYGKEEVYLPAGQNFYNFQFQLGPGLPSTFHSLRGYVQYTLTAEIPQSGWFTSNCRASEDIKVIALVDLNQMPALFQPVDRQLSERLRTCCCCFSSHPLTMSVRLPFTGYIPGMKVSAAVEIDNGSEIVVQHVSVSVCQTLIYHAHAHTKSDFNPVVVGSFCTQSIHPGDKESFVADLLLPPDMEPSGLGLVVPTIIDVRYFLRVKAHMPTCSSDLRLDVDILIGTIPLGGGGGVDVTKSVAAKPSNRGLPNF